MTDSTRPVVDLDAVRWRREQYKASHAHDSAFACCTAHGCAEDVPPLIAEIERLRSVMSGTAAALGEVAEVCGAADEYRSAMLSAHDRLREAARQ